MAVKRKVLAAVPSPALAILERALGEHVQLVAVHNLDQAVGCLRAQTEMALILCGVHFDDSRMFDLLRAARSDFAAIPFVCCRIFHAELPHVTIQAIDIAAKSLGAAEFLDMPALARQFGNDGADARFRGAVLAHLQAGVGKRETGL